MTSSIAISSSHAGGARQRSSGFVRRSNLRRNRTQASSSSSSASVVNASTTQAPVDNLITARSVSQGVAAVIPKPVQMMEEDDEWDVMGGVPPPPPPQKEKKEKKEPAPKPVMAAPPPPPKHESVKFEWEPAMAATSSKAGKDFMDNSAMSWKLPEVPLFEDPPVFIDENGFAAKPRQQEPGPSSFVTLPETPVAPKMSQPRSSSMYNRVDERAMVLDANFPITPDELIERTNEILKRGVGEMADDLALDFQFVGPVVGPLAKEEFLKAIGTFDVTTGFPDMQSNYYHFRVDPFEPDRVWFTSRPVGRHTGTFAGSIEPTGIRVVCPPQAMSMTFNRQGEVKKFTVGAVMDRTAENNTGGLGGMFAFFYAVGSPLPFPEAKPWKMSKRYRFFTGLGRIFGGGGSK